MNDNDILSGFASLHQAMLDGFARSDQQINALRTRLDERCDQLVNDIARLEHRVLVRFDDVDERFDRLEMRVTALEARTA